MKRLRFSDAKRFHNVVKNELSRHEAENNLILGILNNVLAGDYKQIDPYMAVVEDQGHIQQILLRTPPFPVLVDFRTQAPSSEVVEVVIDGLRSAYGDELSGMTGDTGIVKAYAQAWGRATGLCPEIRTAMRIYRLDEVKPVRDVQGRLKWAGPEDRETISAWFRAFQKEALGEEVEEKRLSTTVHHYLTGDAGRRGLALWEVSGRPVSMAGYSGPTPHGIRISAVYTPPDFRRQGYASACVATLSQYLLDLRYQFCFLFTDLANPTSNHIYQEIGYRRVSDVDKYVFQGREGG